MSSVADELGRVPLFAGLSQRELRKLARDVKEHRFDAGRTVLREGQTSGIGLFLIREGEAAVSVDGAQVARLGPGEHFGALGLIRGARTATVTATSDLRCLMLSSSDFRRFVKANPDVCRKLLEHVVDLLADAEERETIRRRLAP